MQRRKQGHANGANLASTTMTLPGYVRLVLQCDDGLARTRDCGPASSDGKSLFE